MRVLLRVTLEVCSKWGPKRRTLVAAVGGRSLASVVLTMLSSESSWVAIADFCEDVISQKEAAERVLEEAPDAHPLRCRGGTKTAAICRSPSSLGRRRVAIGLVTGLYTSLSTV
ncbi:jg17570 [Pararge aegeria aegeria]|uniref:Jg17570 protein n=1 Tax=Pararge aegeria aegeria TaxID=348720 RepID=A0A8S4QY71_9NEOP|nr:jg17570 [Pararge aegeria aegeria]